MMQLYRLAALLTAVSCASTPDSVPGEPVADPFAALPVPETSLTDVSSDLEAVLENGTLRGACADYADDRDDPNKKLLCGKAMFFGESFDAVGVPIALFDALPVLLPELVGPAWSAFGLIADPYSPEGRPLGFPLGRPLPGGAPTVAFGCASCHFGQLPDGRYAVGMPNLDYDYGRQMVTVAMSPLALTPGFDPATQHPEALAQVQPVLDAFANDPDLTVQLIVALTPLLGEEAVALSPELQGQYAGWAPGTMDFVIAPLPLEDEVHVVSRILPLWEIPSAEQAQQDGALHAQLAWTGAAPDLMHFLQGFVAVAGSESPWTEERMEPLRAYLSTLRAPAAPPGDPAAIARGRGVFFSSDCIDCHRGPRGGSMAPHSLDEIGTDPALASWGDPDPDGTFCCGMGSDTAPPTLGVKAPRMTGLWTQRGLLHNGSVPSIEALLCLEPRPGIDTIPYRDSGHTYGCGLPIPARRSLTAFLRSL